MTKKELLEATVEIKKECERHTTCVECALFKKDFGCIVPEIMEDNYIEFISNELTECEAHELVRKHLKVHDNVNSPAHYCKGGIECIDAIKSATVGLQGVEGYCIGNAIKYLWRWKFKNGLEDLKKARWYIDRTIQELESANNADG